MACNIELIEFICSQINDLGIVRYRKMFGEYMIYLNEKPVILVCDDIAYVKKHEVIQYMMHDAEKGRPFEGANEWYILDVEYKSKLLRIIGTLENVLPYPKPKNRKKKNTVKTPNKQNDIMEKIRIKDISTSTYRIFRDLYENSFPVFEQRTEEQQESAFKKENYHLDTYWDCKQFIGFIAYWEFETYIYIEHFAINTEIRGKGYGSSILNSFTESTGKTVILEIDPVNDSISEARLRFYQRCGFYENNHPHTHPAYREGYTPHPLTVMTTQRKITVEEYNKFNSDLCNIVM